MDSYLSSGISGQSFPFWKNGYFPNQSILKIRSHSDLFGLLQNGTSSFRTFDASHSSQSVCRLQVTLGHGQSSRIVGDISYEPETVAGLILWSRG
jgi:hypothetical protein